MKNVLTTFVVKHDGYQYMEYALFPRGLSMEKDATDKMLKQMYDIDLSGRGLKVYKIQEVTREQEDVLRDLHIAF
jgi:hypothetical protein